MRIAIIVTTFLPKWNAGTENATYNIAKYLTKRGHEVNILTSLDDGLPEFSKQNNICIYRIDYPRIMILGTILFWIQVALCIKKLGPQIVHAQGIHSAFPAYLSYKLWSVPYIVWGRGSDVYAPWKFKKIISTLILRNSRAIIALTKDMKERMKELYDKEIYVIPNGIDATRNHSNMPKAAIRRKLKIDQDERIIISVGRLHYIKGLKYLIMAVGDLKIEEPKIKAIIIGKDQGERANLELLAKKLNVRENILFIGELPNKEVMDYLKASDIFVLPSLSEGFPNTILEAMLNGLPIIASNVGGISEILADTKNGYLINPKDHMAIAARIKMLLKDDPLRSHISENNIITANLYNWEKIVNYLESIYFDISRCDLN